MMVVTKHLNRHREVRSVLFLYDALVSPHGEHAWLYGLRCLSPKCVPRGYLLVERKQARPGVDRHASRRMLQGQQQRLAWMSSCWSRDFTEGCLLDAGGITVSRKCVVGLMARGALVVSRKCVVALMARGALVVSRKCVVVLMARGALVSAL
jgi:hypothetical protein